MMLGNGKATFIAAMFGLLLIAVNAEYGDSFEQFFDSKDEYTLYLDAAKKAEGGEIFQIDMETLSLESSGENLAVASINSKEYLVKQFASLSDISVIGQAKEAYLYTTRFAPKETNADDIYALCFRSEKDAVCTSATPRPKPTIK